KAPAAPRTIGIDALIALQGVEDPIERRRHAVRRGRLALDALDELKIGLLGGTLSTATLNKLRSAATYLKDGSAEAHLDGVLDEIELRVEVEIAKAFSPLAGAGGRLGLAQVVHCIIRDSGRFRYCPFTLSHYISAARAGGSRATFAVNGPWGSH